MDIERLTLVDIKRLLDTGESSAQEITEAYLARIEAVEPHIHAFLTVTADEAREQARQADERRAKGENAPLLGVPLALKDVISTAGVRTTCGSRMLETYVPPFDATVVQRLREAGALFLGKTNTDEFAMGSSTENSAFGATRNPWDTTRVPGGSSGGSAAAVAAAEAPAALGTDTGGSVRQPAALCGVVGLKPTYGRVSRYGLIAYASSLDQIGPLTRTVADAALLLSVIAGHDPLDSTSGQRPVPDYVAALAQADVKGKRLGVVRDWLDTPGLHPGVREAVQTALATYESLGATLVDITLPHSEYGLPVYYLIAPAEASSNLARYDGVLYGHRASQTSDIWDLFAKSRGEGFGPEVKRRIMLGTYALSAGYYDQYYKKAQKVRTLIRRDFEQAFEQVDVVVGPTSPVPAFELGERTDDPIQMYLADIFTLTVNLAGLPGISIPCGFADGLPVGLQLIGRAWDETTLLQIAHVYEQATDWHTRTPSETNA
nr:Asp-tRNA(Asn)/Glu-tRNA(Gln) amidotransferase subunit GatA [Ardenticatena sp.]